MASYPLVNEHSLKLGAALAKKIGVPPALVTSWSATTWGSGDDPVEIKFEGEYVLTAQEWRDLIESVQE